MVRSKPWMLLIAVAFAACASETESLDGGLDAGTDGGPTPDGGRPDGGFETKPILERPSSGEYACSAHLPVDNLQPLAWVGFRQSHQLTEVAGQLLLARAEGIVPDRFGIPEQVRLVVSEMSADGSLLERSVVPSDEPELVSNVALTPHRFGYALVWGEGQTVHAASFDQDDQLEKLGPLPITGEIRSLAVADAGEELAVVWTQAVNEYEQLWFGRFAPGGGVVGRATQLDTAVELYSTLAPAILETVDGFLVVWRNDDVEGGAVYTQQISAAGTLVGDRTRISTTEGPGHSIARGAGFDGPKIAIRPRPGGFLIAWVESYQDPESWDPGSGWATIAIAQLDPQGARVGPPVQLQAPVPDRNAVEPELLSFGPRIGVMWSDGERIYVCGGCVPDHDVRLVLIDPETLRPASELVTLSSAGLGGGLLYRSSAVLGDQLMTALRIVFHVDSQPGVGGFRCPPLE